MLKKRGQIIEKIGILTHELVDNLDTGGFDRYIDVDNLARELSDLGWIGDKVKITVEFISTTRRRSYKLSYRDKVSVLDRHKKFTKAARKAVCQCK
jgi:hypothetical protein